MIGIWVPLTQGYAVLVDRSDFPVISAFKWCATKNGKHVYAKTSAGNRGLYLHRLLFGWPVDVLIDHRNGDTLDCRRQNLRVTDSKGNAKNRAGKGELKGLTRRGGVYQVRIGKTTIGTFEDEAEAARAYDEAATRLYGEFARLNFPARPQIGSAI